MAHGEGARSATRVAITVDGVSEYQWTAKATGLAATTSYCYRVYLGSSSQVNLLGTDASPVLKTLPTSPGTYSFAVLGDWGQSFANGNPYQSSLLTHLKSSGRPTMAICMPPARV